MRKVINWEISFDTFIQENKNYFPKLESFADKIFEKIKSEIKMNPFEYHTPEQL